MHFDPLTGECIHLVFLDDLLDDWQGDSENIGDFIGRTIRLLHYCEKRENKGNVVIFLYEDTSIFLPSRTGNF